MFSPHSKLSYMERNDILGNDGRRAIHAVVKVSTFGYTWKYTRIEVEKRLRGCFSDPQTNLISSVLPDRENAGKRSYDIGDIHKALTTLLKMEGTETSRKKEDEEEINKARREIETEYQKSLPFLRVEKVSLKKGYESFNETFPSNEANEPHETNLEQIIQREVVDDLDTFSSDSSDHKIPPVIQDTDCDDEDDASPDEEKIQTESLDPEAWVEVEDDHGSGFIVRDNLIVTSKHVVEGATKIVISNAVIRELPCDIVEKDAENDLALLYCEKLDLAKSGICPLELSEREPLQGLPVFTLGYPITHTGKAALFLKGYVAGETGERYGREPLLTFNFPVNNGNSGGPVFWRCEEDKLEVVAVLKEKHLKRISSCEEEWVFEQLRSELSALKSRSTADKDQQNTSLIVSLMSKWLDSHERNGQRYLANAIRGRFVIDLICDYKKKG